VAPLEREIHALEEEKKMRAALGMRQKAYTAGIG
jgi:hypothetical protein